MARSYHWDGSPVEEDEADWFRSQRTLRLHKSSASRTLRKDAVARCIYCNHPMEWYERYDTKERVPFLLQEFPTQRLPERLRWSVFNGLAYKGDGGAPTCRIVHPAVCPALQHDEERVLEGLRLSYAVKTRSWIHQGVFVPAAKPDVTELDVEEQLVDAGETRHVVHYTWWTVLAPTVIDEVRCVALAASTGERCKNMVLSDDLYEGQWSQVEIRIPPGREGRRQATLWEGQQMWVYDLNALYPEDFRRWQEQRCRDHDGGSAPNAVLPQWVTFDTFRHSEFITIERPATVVRQRHREDHPLLKLMRPLATDAARCSAEGCSNRSHRAEEKGWLCWQCAPVARRRARIHDKWQAPHPADGEDPPF